MDRIKALHGPRTQAYRETNYLDEKKIEFCKVGYIIKTLSYSILGSKYYKRLRPIRVLRRW